MGVRDWLRIGPGTDDAVWPLAAMFGVTGAATAAFLAVSAGGSGALFLTTVALPVTALALLLSPVLSLRYRRWAAEELRPHRQLAVGVASAVGGIVFVALAVLVATVDSAAWQAIADDDQVVALFLAPVYTWAATVAVVVFVFLGCLTHAVSRWDSLREAAGVVALNAAFVAPLALLLVAYQLLRLVDVNIARTEAGP